MKKVRVAIFYENNVNYRTLKPAQIIHVEGARAIQLLREKKKKPEERPTAARRPLWQEDDERFGVSSKSKGYEVSGGESSPEQLRPSLS